MEKIDLGLFLKETCRQIREGKLNGNVIGFQDRKSKYVHPTPKAYVTLEFTNGVEAKVDITEYLKSDLR